MCARTRMILLVLMLTGWVCSLVGAADVGLLVLHTDKNQTHCTCAQQTVRAYAEQYGYAYRLVEELMSVEAMAAAADANHRDKPMHVKFQKYIHVKEELDKHQMVVLLDCDVVVTNFDIKVEELWAGHTNSSTTMMIARDAWSRFGYVPFNTGVIVFKRGEKELGNEEAQDGWLDHLLDDICALQEAEHQTKSGKHWGSRHGLKDQPRMTEELFDRGEVVIPVPRNWENTTERHQHVSIVPQRVMNSFLRSGKMYKNLDPESAKWRQGDWLAHVTGMTHSSQRLGIMKDVLKLKC